MNANTEFSLSRRTMLQSTGALVIAFSMGGATEVLAQAATTGRRRRGRIRPISTSWLSIARDGKVTLFFGKIDGGQGTDLAMGQIVAEELDVPDVERDGRSGRYRAHRQSGRRVGKHGRALCRRRVPSGRRGSAPRAGHARGRAAGRRGRTADRHRRRGLGDRRSREEDQLCRDHRRQRLPVEDRLERRIRQSAGADLARETEDARPVQGRRHAAEAHGRRRQGVRHHAVDGRHPRRRHGAWTHDPAARRGCVGRVGGRILDRAHSGRASRPQGRFHRRRRAEGMERDQGRAGAARDLVGGERSVRRDGGALYNYIRNAPPTNRGGNDRGKVDDGVRARRARRDGGV